VEEQAGSLSVKPTGLAPSNVGNAEVLAREAAGDNINPLEVSPPPVSHVCNFSVCMWEIRPQDAAAIRVLFYLPNGCESGALKAEIDTTDPGKGAAKG
jgi:hypothetical protein